MSELRWAHGTNLKNLLPGETCPDCASEDQLDTPRAENERLTKERDDIETARGVWQKLHADVTAERDKLAAQLADVRAKLELATLALSKREPEPLPETRSK